MPFTFAHPAIVLPLDNLKPRWFSLTGLIAGAVVPDFEYFIRMHIYSTYSHTVKGLFWFDIPLGVLLAFLFHNIARNNLYDNLPPVLSKRLSPYKTFNWNNHFKNHWPVVLLSVFIGACSHLFLDAFTHPAGYFVKLFSAILNKTIIADIPFYKVLQHSFTLISTIYIIYFFRRMQVGQQVNKPALNYWILVAIFSAIAIAFRFWLMPDYQIIANVIVSIISAFLLAIIIVPMFFKGLFSPGK